MKTLFTPKGEKFFIDDEDFERVSKYKWYASKKRTNSYYIQTQIKGKKVYLHRFILNYTGLLEVDHINLNKFDNTKSNLKICTTYENRQVKNRYKHLSSGGYKGVTKVGDRYEAQLSVNGKTKHLGHFFFPSDAAKKYDEEVIRLKLNRPLNYLY